MAQLAAALAVSAADQRFETRRHLNEGEGFTQIVIGAELKPFNPLAKRVAGGEDQHGFITAFIAPFAQNIEAVNAGEGKVKYRGVIRGAI